MTTKLYSMIGLQGMADANISDVSKELDILFFIEESFMPEGKTLDELTDEEKAEMKKKYRFDPMKPGRYQEITGYGRFIN